MEEATSHGAINKDEACLHMQKLNKIMDILANRVEEGDAGTMRQAIMDYKEAIMVVMPGMEEVDPAIVLAAVKDPSCLAIHPHMEKNQQNLEDLMPWLKSPKEKMLQLT